jgi:hypothetical protein
MEARWANRGHVTLCVRLRSKVYAAAWEVSVEFDVEAGAEMEALSTDVVSFFAASR